MGESRKPARAARTESPEIRTVRTWWCRYCGKPAVPDRSACTEHLAYYRDAQQRSRAARREHEHRATIVGHAAKPARQAAPPRATCRACDAPTLPDRTVCAYHREYFRMTQLRTRAKHLGLPKPPYAAITVPRLGQPGGKRRRARSPGPGDSSTPVPDGALTVNPTYFAIRDMLGRVFVYCRDQHGLRRLELDLDEQRRLAPQLAGVQREAVEIDAGEALAKRTHPPSLLR